MMLRAQHWAVLQRNSVAGRSTRRRGVALATALGALLLVSLLAAGSTAWSIHLQRSATGALHELQARENAEYGVTWVLANWRREWSTSLAPGEAIEVYRATPIPSTEVAVTLARGGGALFLIASTGQAGMVDPRRTARRRLVALVQLDLPSELPRAALTALGPLRVAGVVSATGSTSAPACGIQQAALALPDSALLCIGSCSGGGSVTGNPALLVDPALGNDAWRERVIDPLRRYLSERATVVGDTVPAVLATPIGPSDCAAGASGSAGCGGTPVVYARGDVAIDGAWRGALLADGRVELRNGASWRGLVVALGGLSIGSGSRLVGAAIVRNGAAYSEVGPQASVVYEPCEVMEVLLRVARPLVLPGRWLMEVF